MIYQLPDYTLYYGHTMGFGWQNILQNPGEAYKSKITYLNGLQIIKRKPHIFVPLIVDGALCISGLLICFSFDSVPLLPSSPLSVCDILYFFLRLCVRVFAGSFPLFPIQEVVYNQRHVVSPR